MHKEVESLFRGRGWRPMAFQERAWDAYLAGGSGLICAPTGLGKTWAAWLGPVIEGIREGGAKAVETKSKKGRVGEPLRVLWITPLRALANDTLESLREPVDELGLNWTVQLRTGDTPQSVKVKQKERLPTALVTTPESLSVLLSYPDAQSRFATLRCVVVDEWHELLGTKRGVQAELCIARLRSIAPGLRSWGVSATLGNLDQARDVLLGAANTSGELICGQAAKELDICTIIPADIERFPWAGHLGTRCVEQVIHAVRAARTTLLFTNTRSQAEIWFRRLMTDAPDLMGQVAIHHGSLDRKLRGRIEVMLGEGKLKCVVCTSSLDLGVDFAPVDQVLQVGSPKGVARLVQRAGRSGHQPGAKSRVLGVPANAFELVEFAAARQAAAAGQIDERTPLRKSMDVLVQHMVTVSCAGGFDEEELKREVRSTFAFAGMTDQEWGWAMDFVTRGGPALKAYPDYARVHRNEEGKSVAASDRLARRHRMGIGTITSESSINVKYTSGKTLGHVEESFVSRLSPGSRFVLSGRVLELIRVREMTAYVRRATRKSGIVPRWDGGRFSLSTQLAAAVRRQLSEAGEGKYDGPEMRAIRPLLELQKKWSVIPGPRQLLVESIKVDRVHHLFLFPFQGRAAHEGLGALLAYRLSKRAPLTVISVANDYGIGLKSDAPMPVAGEGWRDLFSQDLLLEDLAACLNSANFARRQFRDIARVAGLIIPGFPGAQRPMRHVQASSEMFFKVFEDFDPDNLLLDQARREVLDMQLEVVRLRSAMQHAAGQEVLAITPLHLTPMSFPIWAEHLRATTLSSEKWSDMVQKMVVDLERSADTEKKPERKVVRAGR